MHPHLHSPRRGLPGTAAAPFTPSVRSCDQPHSVRWGGSWIWCVSVCVFFSLWAGFVVKLVNLNLSFLLAIWFIELTVLLASLSGSTWFCDEQRRSKGIVVEAILHTQTWFPSYHAVTRSRELDLMDAVFSQNLIWGCGLLLAACWLELNA